MLHVLAKARHLREISLSVSSPLAGLGFREDAELRVETMDAILRHHSKSLLKLELCQLVLMLRSEIADASSTTLMLEVERDEEGTVTSAKSTSPDYDEIFLPSEEAE